MKYSDNNIITKRLSDYEFYKNGKRNTTFTKPYSGLLFPYITDNGGVANDISLTVQAFGANKQYNVNHANRKWVNPEDRQVNIKNEELCFGFKETSPEPCFLSNAFCFANQKINGHISTRGHFTCEINDKWAYTKTKLKIFYTDVVTGNRILLKNFDNFESQPENSERFFAIETPNPNNYTFVENGLFGMIVLTLEMELEFYEDAERKKRIQNVSEKRSSHLQILIYSAPFEAKNVDSNPNIFVEEIIGDERMDELFEKSIFKNYNGINCPELSIDQKRAIIAEQIAVLFASQHPVITGDYYPMKLLGFGAKSTIKPEFILDKAITYSKMFPDVIPMVNNRLYGMLLKYKTFNLAKEIDNISVELFQSKQKIKDPVRIISIKENGKINFDFGNDGIAFDPFAINITNSEMPYDALFSMEFVIPQNNQSVSISPITITDINDLPITSSTKTVKISFEILNGETIIDKIKYSIWTSNNLGWYEYTTNEIETSHIFNLDEENKIQIVGGNEVTLGDIVKTQIEITDINGKTNTFYQDCFLPENSGKPSIIDVSAEQATNGSKTIDVNYTYIGTSEINNSYVTLQFSTNKTTWANASKNIYGDIGQNVMPGHKRIKWFPTDEISDDIDIIYIRLSILDADNKTNIAVIKDIPVYVDFNRPDIAIRRISNSELIDMLNTSSSSESSSSSNSSSSNSSSSSMEYSSSSNSSSSSTSTSSSSTSHTSSSSLSSVSSSSSTWIRSSSSSSTSSSSSSSSMADSTSSSSSSMADSTSSSSSSGDAIAILITDNSGEMNLWRNTVDTVSVRQEDCVNIPGNSMYINEDSNLGYGTDMVGWSSQTRQIIVMRKAVSTPYLYGITIWIDRSVAGGTKTITIDSNKQISNWTFTTTNPNGVTNALGSTSNISNGNLLHRLQLSHSGDHYPQILTVYFE